MRNWFLKIKHWQLFLLLCLPSLGSFGFMLAIFVMCVLEKPIFGTTYLCDGWWMGIGLYWLLSLVALVILSLQGKQKVRGFFLKSKHWQLFLMVCLPLLFYYGGFFSLAALMVWDSISVFHVVFDILGSLMCYMCIVCVIIIVPTTLVVCHYLRSLFWLFNDKLPASLKKNKSSVCPFLFPSCIGIAIGAIACVFMGFLWALFCGGLLCCFFLFSFSILAKRMKMAELQRRVQVKEVLGDFFLFLFFPVGVWFLQPKVNRMYEENDKKYLMY